MKSKLINGVKQFATGLATTETHLLHGITHPAEVSLSLIPTPRKAGQFSGTGENVRLS